MKSRPRTLIQTHSLSARRRRAKFALHTPPPTSARARPHLGTRTAVRRHRPPAAPRTGRSPPWPVHLETFTQATAPPLRYHVNALARPCRRLRARGGRRQRVRECGHSEQQCGQSAVERSAVGVPSMRMKPSMEICGSGVGQRLRQLISTLADLMPRSTIIYWPSHLPCGYRTQRSEQKAVSEHFNRHRTGH